MFMFSQMQRFTLRDGRGHEAKLIDLSIALLEGDHPPVKRLLYGAAGDARRILPWEAVRLFDERTHRIELEDLEAGEEVTPEKVEREVLLGRDVLDALVLDLQNRRATRVNDLQMGEEGGRLHLLAADASVQGILRRLSRGLYRRVVKKTLYDWKYIEFLRGDPQAVRSGAGYHLRINRLPPGEIARLSDPLPYLHAAELLTLLPDPKAADALEAMAPERQLQVFEELDEDQATRLLALMAPDVAADLVGQLQTATMKRYLERIPKERSELIIELLRYPEDTTGGIMTNEMVYLPAGLRASDARRLLGERLRAPDFVYLIYVVDADETRKLLGMIPLRDLLTAGDEELLEEVMNPYLAPLHPLDGARHAAYRVINSHLAALPVVGAEGQLMGVVTIDAAVAQVAPPNWSTQAPRIFS